MATSTYVIPFLNWVATILDDDRLPVSITGGSAVTEGSTAEFTVSTAQPGAAALAVQLTVTAASVFTSSGDEGGKTVVIAKGKKAATYEVQPQRRAGRRHLGDDCQRRLHDRQSVVRNGAGERR
ncbi:MAG: hypothetical protein F4226_03170 [Synechococcus sp. SB0678_bin_12]|nr:hypothetical protein [Synechococcus sp. SB0678_bin_12]